MFFSSVLFIAPPPLPLHCIKECSLYRVAGVHWSSSTPMSHTHPMCLLLATLTKREGRGGEGAAGRQRERRGSQRERERERKKGGGGGEWGIWYALCMSDLYKTKRGQKNVWMFAKAQPEHTPGSSKKRLIIYSRIFFASICILFHKVNSK